MSRRVPLVGERGLRAELDMRFAPGGVVAEEEVLRTGLERLRAACGVVGPVGRAAARRGQADAAARASRRKFTVRPLVFSDTTRPSASR